MPRGQYLFPYLFSTLRASESPNEGSGTVSDPYVVDWTPNDPENAMAFSTTKKWLITIFASWTTITVALASSAYTGGIAEVMGELGASDEVATLGVSLFVLGFALGPLIWAPLSEQFGRHGVFLFTYICFTAFNAGAAGAQNIESLIVFRFFAGAFGSSSLTTPGGMIADMFPPSERPLAMIMFSSAPSLGPVIGPIIGGFLGMTRGWRWIEGLLAIVSGSTTIIGLLFVPETLASVILRHRARNYSRKTGKTYRSRLDIMQEPSQDLGSKLRIVLLRPWVLLFREPIVLLLSLYIAIIYGTLYLLFAAFPIVYTRNRNWNAGLSGLAFLGLLIGIIFAIACAIIEHYMFTKLAQRTGKAPSPEYRLRSCTYGGFSLTIGLFWFAWTNSPSIHGMVSIASGVPFGFGSVVIFMSIFNYLVESYTIFSASVLAANSVLRSLFGAVFPLFTTYMYDGLGIHWASSIPAFLSVLCLPLPFIFLKYGPVIRRKSKFAAESAEFVEEMRRQAEVNGGK